MRELERRRNELFLRKSRLDQTEAELGKIQDQQNRGFFPNRLRRVGCKTSYRIRNRYDGNVSKREKTLYELRARKRNLRNGIDANRVRLRIRMPFVIYRNPLIRMNQNRKYRWRPVMVRGEMGHGTGKRFRLDTRYRTKWLEMHYGVRLGNEPLLRGRL